MADTGRTSNGGCNFECQREGEKYSVDTPFVQRQLDHSLQPHRGRRKQMSLAILVGGEQYVP